MKAQVIVVMGSHSDLKVMKKATDFLKAWSVKVETQILSAHRTPQLLQKSVVAWEKSGVEVVIAGAGGAAHLPGMLASFSVLPVIGVPVKSSSMNGLDALLSVAQMPKGVPVATVAVDNAVNAALLAAQILAVNDDRLRTLLLQYKKKMASQVLQNRNKLRRVGVNKFLRDL